ncbi:hypothetical protein [Devosia beringensis]|uniref:hypothetical protein n=1 Tax=Devosia beringensis TaxID=2657486 RepID=UPI00186B66C0|nr:hypothetical protein [Devosia beringensis]
MITWFKKLVAGKTAPHQASASRQASPENCALWRDVARALDAKPKNAGMGTSKMGSGK